ncbi:MAG: hypothetical protein AMJ89_01780 [candidate division Zixibacteria bacterium SM23_73]|nr:MAG: hypothetical protein AMJ89_01780 [candidate division Zixibacteria bacterium SM23_73]
MKAHDKFTNLESRYFFYDGYMNNKSDCWLDGNTLPEFEIKKLFNFIRSWDKRFSGDLQKFKRCYKKIYDDVKQLKHKRIHSIDFCNVETGQRIQRIFGKIVECGKNRPEYTDASKIMHTVLPELFVMWDDEIRKKLRKTHQWKWPKEKAQITEEYVFKFLPQMQREANEVIVSYTQENYCNPREAVNEISRRGGNYTLAKLLDEYNYVKYRLKKDP